MFCTLSVSSIHTTMKKDPKMLCFYSRLQSNEKRQYMVLFVTQGDPGFVMEDLLTPALRGHCIHNALYICVYIYIYIYFNDQL